MVIQSWIPAAACCIHNIIRQHDPNDVDIPSPDTADKDSGLVLAPEEGDVGTLQDVPLTADMHRQMNTLRDTIAAQIWLDYCAECVRQGLPHIVEQL